MKPKDGEDET